VGRKKAPSRRTSRKKGSTRRRRKSRRPGPLYRFVLKASIGAALILSGFLTVAVVDINWRFTHNETPAPIRIYSAPLTLEPGAPLRRADLSERLRRLGYRQVERHPATPGEYNRRSGTFTIHLNAFDYPDGPTDPFTVRLRIRSDRVRSVRNAEMDEKMTMARLEPEQLGVLSGDVHEERIPVALDEFPQALLDSVIAVEDRRFHRHSGIAPRGVGRALLANLREGEVVQGGSTITQQLAKNLYPGHADRTVTQKLWETLAAFGLEAFRSKDDILERYLNEIYMAQRGPFAILGMGAASRHYFGKDAQYLDLSESALLAGLIQSPGRYQPYRHPEAARRRRNLVLTLMKTEGFIDEEQHRAATAAPLGVRPEPSHQRRQAPYFIDYVAQDLDRLIGRSSRRRRGLRIVTTLDPLLQARAEKALTSRLASYESTWKHLRELPGGALQGALVALDPQDGSLLAMVGGRDYGRSQFNRVSQARRQPGSMFKPFVYLAGFRQAQIAGDASFTAATVLEDSPLEMKVGGKQWTPGNTDGLFRGAVGAREALALSLNVPTIRAAEMIGLNEVVRTARRCGIESPLQPVPSLALGTFEVTPLELASAFTSLAGLGIRSAPRAIVAISNPDGELINVPGPEHHGATSPEAAYLTLDLMRDVLAYGTGARVQSFDIEGDFAGKTGTTDDGRDAWFIGFSPDYLALAWVGFDNNRPLRLGGSTLALPIWADLTGSAMHDRDRFWDAPEGLVVERIDPQTGELAGWQCDDSLREVFIAGTEPTEICALHGSQKRESWVRRLRNWFRRD
jgi:penicillin-binding protein 1B